jgi:hypothetical protein
MKPINVTASSAALALMTFLVIAGAIGSASAQQATTVATLTPAPTPTPRPSPTPRVFSCSCGNYGNAVSGIPPVAWRGTVQASDSLFARQAATGQCLGYLGARPGSVIIPTPGVSFGGSAPTPPPLVFNPCAICACN